MAIFPRTPSIRPRASSQGFIEGRIAEIEDIISRTEVIDFCKLTGKVVKFGATVRLADEDTDEKVKYQIVGPYEADLAKGRISDHLADRPGPDRQDRGRHGRGPDAARRASPTKSWASSSTRAAIMARARRMPVDFMIAYWMPNRPILLPIAQIDFTADQRRDVERRAPARC